MTKRMNYKQIVSLKIAKRASFLLVVTVLTNFSYFVPAANAQEGFISASRTFNSTSSMEFDDIEEEDLPEIMEATTTMNDFINRLPISGIKPIGKKVKIFDHGYHPITAYTSEVAQTDGDPCTTANGFNVCKHGKEDTIAANFLRFNTKVRIPDLYGDRVFVVRDRMNSRYKDTVDVWLLDKKEAIKFGRRTTRIEIIVEE